MFLIRNIDTGDISIDDLGITIAAGQDYDLSQEEPAIVATSVDLPAAITGGTVRVLETLDGSPRTVLSAAESLLVVSLHNEPHYRIRGGELDQLDDVDTTGATGGQALTLQSGTWKPATVATAIDRVQKIHVGKHGSDSNDGLTPEKAKITFAAAISAATPTGSPNVPFTVVCEDAGIYVEDITVPSNIRVHAPNAKISGTVTVNDNAELFIKEVEAPINTSAIQKLTGSGTSRVSAELLRATGTGDTVRTAAANVGPFIVEVSQIFTENGACVIDNSTSSNGHIHIDAEDVYITGTGNGLDRSSGSGLIVGKVSHILEIAGGVGNGTGVEVGSGTVDVIVGFLDATIGYNVTANGTLRMLVNQISGARVQTSGLATVDVMEADALRWITKTFADSPFIPRRIGFVAVDTSSGSVTMDLPYPPSDGDNISFQDARNNFKTNNFIVNGNGANIESAIGSPESVTFNVNGTSGVFVYNASLSQWNFSRIQEEVAFSPSNLIYVTKNGNDTTGDGSFSNPFLTIKRGVTEALVRVSGSPVAPVTVKVLDGIYDEINPISISGTKSEFVTIQGEQQSAVIVRPTVVGSALFAMTSTDANLGPSLNRMTFQGNAAYRSTPGSVFVSISGDGRFVMDKIDMNSAFIGVDTGNGVVTNNETVYDFATISNCGTAIDAKNGVKQAIQVAFFRSNDVAIHATDDTLVEAGNFFIQGAGVGGSPLSGVGFNIEDTAQFTGNSAVFQNLATGIKGNDTSVIRLFATFFRDNITDFYQFDSGATIQIQGSLSKTKQLIADGANISLNYVDTDTGDYIVGNADIRGGSPFVQDTGKEFRVRDFDGRVFIGDNATDDNAATNTVGGSRSINLIDTNGNLRVWRWQATPGLHPAFEWIKGENPIVADNEGDVPITSFTAGTPGVVTIDVSGTDYNHPLDPIPGSNRETLAERAFSSGVELRINNTTSNDGNYTVASSVYNSGPQTIDITVNEAIVAESPGGSAEVVFGGGAGRPDGVSTYIDDPSSAIAAKTGNVHWDMLLRETDHFVIRRRTGGGGKEHVRVFRDRTEFQHGPAYGGADNELVLVVQGVSTSTSSSNYLTINNASPTGNPEIVATGTGVGSPQSIDIEMLPKGEGTVTVYSGYENFVVDDSLITKAYLDGILTELPVVQVRRTATLAIPTAFADISFDITDIENNTAVLEHNNTNTDNIDVKEDGLYIIFYNASIDADAGEEIMDVRVRVNDTTVIPGSLRQISEDDEINDVGTLCVASLTAGDFITFQVQASGTGNVLATESTYGIFKLRGAAGAAGTAGVQGPAGPAGPSGTEVELPAVQVGSTASLSVVPPGGTYQDLFFDTTDVENDSTVIEHLGVGGSPDPLSDRIQVKEDGLYFIDYHATMDSTPADIALFRVRINDTTVIPGSESETFTTASSVPLMLNASAVVSLSANDYVTLQADMQGTSTGTADMTITFLVVKLKGSKGESGVSAISDEGAPQGSASELDFVGAGVTATVSGSPSVATITIPGNTQSHLFRHNSTTTQTFSAATTINFGTNVRTDSNYTHAIVVGGSEITVNTSGWYKITYDVTANGTTGTRSDAQHLIEVNGSTLAGSVAQTYHRTTIPGEQTGSATVKANLTATDVVRVRSSVTNGTAIVTVANGCRLNIESIDSP